VCDILCKDAECSIGTEFSRSRALNWVGGSFVRVAFRNVQNQILPSLLPVPHNLRSQPVFLALNRLDLFLLNDGKYVAARKIAEKMVLIAERIWGAKSICALDATLHLSAIYATLGFL
jgi:hypothetical protein